MKSTKQIFKNNKELLSNDSVIELIDYCHELEDEVISNNQKYSFENKLTELIREIYSSINEIVKEDNESKRFGEIKKINYEETIINLKEYLEIFSIDNNFKIK